MQGKHMTKRLLAGLMSLVLLLSLLPALSAPAEAADEFFTVSGTVNDGTPFTAKQNPMSDDDPTTVATIPTMYVGKNQCIRITASQDVTWSVVLGERPKELDFDCGDRYWELSGSGLQPVTARFLLKATPLDGSESREIWIYYYCFNESSRPQVTTTSLPSGNVGSEYRADLSFSGAYNGWTEWEIVSGSLPAGLELHYNLTTCYIAGTPTAQGTATFSLRVTTVSGTSAVKELSLFIDRAKQDPAFKTGQTVFAQLGGEYTADAPLCDLNSLITADGYPALDRASWEAASGLPAGLTMDTNGIITGTVADTAKQGTYYVKASVANGEGTSYDASLEVYVYAQPTAVVKESESTEKTVAAGEYFIWQPLTGNETTGEMWELVSGSTEAALKSDYGLYFNTASGSIWGTPTRDGTLTLAVQRFARDNHSQKIPGAASDPVTLKLTITQDRRFVLSQSGDYSFPSAKREDGAYTQPAAKTFTVTGTGYSDVAVTVALSGDGAESFTLGGTTTKTLKKGETLQFTVQPAAALAVGTYTATVTVSDAANADSKKTFNVSFVVSDQIVRPAVQGTNLPWTKVGAKYEYQFSASGTGPFQWSLKEGAPEWLSIDKDTGILTGTVPADAEDIVRFSVIAANAADSGYYGEREFYFYAYGAPQLKMQLGVGGPTYTGTTEGGRTILPDAYVGKDYMIEDKVLMFSTSDSDGYIKLSFEGALPEGMRGPSDNNWSYLSLTPTKTGTYDFTVVVKQYANSERTDYVQESRCDLRITVLDRLKKENIEGTLRLEVGKESEPIDLNKYVSGGKKPYTIQVRSDLDLPEGLKLENGILSGTPRRSTNGAVGTYFAVEDANGTKTDANIYCYYLIELPPLELTDPLKGATFINSISVGLSDSFKAKLSDTAEYTLDYKCTSNGGGTTLVNETKLTGQGKDARIEIPAETLSGVKVGQNVCLIVGLRETGGRYENEWVYYTRVAAPSAPTASPGTAGGTTTFSGMVDVMLAATTSGSGVGIRYTTDGTDPKTSATARDYTGTFITLTEDATIKACCCTTAGAETVYSDVAEFKYVKTAGVSVSGVVKSYDQKNATTVQLKQSGAVQYETTIAAQETTDSAAAAQTFCIADVAPGTYDLVVTKPGHLTYTVTGVTVGTADMDLTKHTNADISTITLLVGDVDGDGFINSTDLNLVWNAANYNKAVSAAANRRTDLDGDGLINSTDLNLVWNSANYNKSTATCTVSYS